MQRLIHLLKAILGLAAGVALLIALVYAAQAAHRWWIAEPFDREAWTSVDPPATPAARGRMADAAVDWLREERPTRDEVLAQLGAPHMSSTPRRPQWDGDFTYYIGHERNLLSFDPFSIEIWFGDDDRVRRVEIRQR